MTSSISSNSPPIQFTIVRTENKFSTWERIERVALGIIASIASLGIALFFQPVRDLFTKGSYWEERKFVTGSELEKRFPDAVFGATKWRRYLGDVNDEPLLPENISDVLESNCPFWEGRKVHETHELVLIPTRVNNVPLTINYLSQLISNPVSGYPNEFSYHAGEEYQYVPNDKTRWMLMTKNVIEKSRCLDVDLDLGASQRQTKLEAVASYPNYQAPKLIELTSAIFAHYVKTGEKIFLDDVDSSYHSHIRDEINNRNGYIVGWPEHPVQVVGGWGRTSSGLEITPDRAPYNLLMSASNGAAAARYFEDSFPNE